MNLITWIKSKFERHLFIKENPRTYKPGGGWGNAIGWVNSGGTNEPKTTWKVYGWKDHKPERGDFLLSEMHSGRVGRFVFVSVEYCGDPPDMFFGEVTFLDYAESSEAQSVERSSASSLVKTLRTSKDSL